MLFQITKLSITTEAEITSLDEFMKLVSSAEETLILSTKLKKKTKKELEMLQATFDINYNKLYKDKNTYYRYYNSLEVEQ